DFNGADSFSYLASDGAADSNTATVSLTVTPVNDAPVAADLSASTAEDTPLTGTLVATDVDSPVLTFRSVTGAAQGTVVLGPAGSFTYTPSQDFNGADNFTYLASDGLASSNTAAVAITVVAVDDAPVAQGQTAVVDERTVLHGTLVATDIDSASLTYRVIDAAAHGTVVVEAVGTFTYTPAAHFHGDDRFT